MDAAGPTTGPLNGWSPGPVVATDRIDAWPVAAFAALLEAPPPDGELPPLWHWFSFLDHPRRSELGEDGHPAAGHFLPPMPDRRRMIAGGRLRVHGPIRVGDVLERRSEMVAVRETKGRSGAMVFVTVRHRLHRDGTLLVEEEQDVVYRSQPPGASRPLPDAAPAPEPTGGIALDTDPALLFRFSAVTYNAHRIHYDLPYTTGVGGYPGLVVHGPLLALLALEVPRRAGRAVDRFAFRLTRPVFVGQRVVAGHRPDGLLVAVPGAPASVTVTI